MGWIDREKNLEHIKKCALDSSTIESVNNSTIFNEELPLITRKDTDCLSAAIEFSQEDSSTTILNFASYTTPGGGFVNGAFAQEESLCGESNLYNILSNDEFKEYYKWNINHKYNGLYCNRAIFTPAVHFYRGDKFFNVLTCAAPNYNVAFASGIDSEIIINSYKWRLQFIYRILTEKKQKLFITGAWGCGVFGFPLDKAIEIFEDVATIDTVLAIPQCKKFNPRKY